MSAAVQHLSDPAGPGSHVLELGSVPQRGAAARLARAWAMFRRLKLAPRALLGVLYVYAAAEEGRAIVRVSKALLARRTGLSRRTVDAILLELEGDAIVRCLERSDRAANVYELPALTMDELASGRASQLLAWREDLDMTCTERAVWGLLLAHGGLERGAWPSVDLIADRLSVSRRCVLYTLAELTRRGLVTTTHLHAGQSFPNGTKVIRGGAVRHIVPALSKVTERPIMRSGGKADRTRAPSDAPPMKPPQPVHRSPRNGCTAPPASAAHLPPAAVAPEVCTLGSPVLSPGGKGESGPEADVTAVLDRIAELYGSPLAPRSRYTLSKERRILVRAKLRDGYSREELVRAAENAKAHPRWDAYWSRVACHVAMLLRSADTIDELLAVRPIRKTKTPAPVIAPKSAHPTIEQRREMLDQIKRKFALPGRSRR